ncbi:hypothetical protein E2C01_033266 [Portunus trituberculatus]|uniref:Uncharacterized protein n=1 Tax=Portunus trituberculatus TaxID=210409 RepID=A0A5B7F3A8_PORTR|nr:hypothetical protein [Portunus trituberculatus]
MPPPNKCTGPLLRTTVVHSSDYLLETLTINSFQRVIAAATGNASATQLPLVLLALSPRIPAHLLPPKHSLTLIASLPPPDSRRHRRRILARPLRSSPPPLLPPPPPLSPSLPLTLPRKTIHCFRI